MTTTSGPKTSDPLFEVAGTARMATVFVKAIEGRFLIAAANDAFLALSGYDRLKLEDTSLTKFLGRLTDATTAASVRRAVEAQKSGAWETQCRRSDGSEFLAAIFLTPVPEEENKIYRYFLSLIDIGAPVARLLDQRNELHALYENAPGFIATSTGPNHQFTFANAAYKRFVRRDDLVGRTVAEAIPEIVTQGFVDLLDTVFRTGEPFEGRNIEMAITDAKTGKSQTRYCDFVYQAVRDAGGKIVGLFCEGYDVTAQRESAEALAELQSELIHLSRVNAMGAMATTLAHELNQPLSAITNYAVGAQRLLNAPDSDPARLSNVLRSIEEASHRAGEIIRNLRELTRRREPARIDFDLKVAASECLRLVRATASPGIAFVDAVPDAMMLAADRIQIQQVIINLLRNACDAVRDSDRQEIVLGALSDGTSDVLYVCDTGPGLELEAARNIFSWSDTAKEGGMGLGLSICRTIIEGHRGRIWLEQSGPQGSEFRFSLPRA
ncbi:PAS domain-containing sensor histidine kinase [Sphingomonas japonica]|uniref:histidine kinase n=1 Tax=Sphingomonas japonica TaxID=511662 RepID=A0ABX0U587_9SPHN|nr:ATP-binding protein [Sphingomonas japonica]NIJ25210.1 two-component system sensor kinase FixL [Sphingomonas japonica]